MIRMLHKFGAEGTELTMTETFVNSSDYVMSVKFVSSLTMLCTSLVFI